MKNKKSSEDLLLLERELRAEANRQKGREGEAPPKLSREGCTLPADSTVPLDMLPAVHILRLVEEGVSAEEAFDLIVEGMLRPN